MQIQYRSWLDGGSRQAQAKQLTTVEALPCPLCGQDGEQILGAWVNVEADWLDEESARGEWAVHCGNCGTTGSGRSRPGPAVAAWNERPGASPEVQAAFAAVLDQAEQLI